MELGLERAALESALDVATPVNADSMQQVRFTSGHSAKTTLEFGRAGCMLNGPSLWKRPSKWYINHFNHALICCLGSACEFKKNKENGFLCWGGGARAGVGGHPNKKKNGKSKK